MTKNFVFYDYFKVSQISKEDVGSWNDYFGPSNQSDFKPGLRVKMKATHSGYWNANGRFYLPGKMSKGVSSFRTEGKPTKVLKHHDSDADPVGLIRDAIFVPTVPADLVDSREIQIIMSPTAPMKDQLKAVRDLMRAGVFDREDWKGLGYIELTADIYDPTSIEQIKDGRFDAVSTSFSPGKEVYCLVCAQNLAKDGLCDCYLGGEPVEDELEDGFKFPPAIMAGLMDYREVSLVAIEGDKFATVEIDSDDTSDNKEVLYSSVADLGNNKSEKVWFELRDSLQLKEDTLIPGAKKTKEPDGKEATDTIISELVVMKDEGLISEKELDDSKLSLSNLETLPESVFCGPDKSFPVLNSTHVVAARRLLEKLKDLENKEEITTALDLKEKALGAPSEEEITVIESLKLDAEAVKNLSDKEIRTLFYSINIELVDRDMSLGFDCKECAANLKLATEAQDQVKDLSTTVEDTGSQLSVLRTELRRSYSEYSDQAQRTIDSNVVAEKAKLDLLSVLSVVSGKFDSLELATADLKDKDLEVEKAVIMDSLDLEKISAKINDGMEKEPKGKVKSPVGEKIEDSDLIKSIGAPGQAAIVTIKNWVADGKISDAQRMYARMIMLDQFPKELKFDDIAKPLLEDEEK